MLRPFSAFYHCKHVALTHHQILLAVALELGSGIFAVKNSIVFFQHHRVVLGTSANSHNLSTLRFLFSCVRNNDSTYLFFSWCRKYQHSVC